MLFHNLVRNLILPYSDIADYVPRKGKILDIGCGYGYYSYKLASDSDAREVLGIDPSKEKIESAKKAFKLKNLKYKKSFVEEISGRFDVCLLFDVLYLVPDYEKMDILNCIYKLLNENGVLIISFFNYKNSRLLKLLISIEEKIMVETFKKTYSKYNRLFFSNYDEYKKLIKNSHFRITKTVDVRGKMHYPQTILVCQKN